MGLRETSISQHQHIIDHHKHQDKWVVTKLDKNNTLSIKS